MRKLKTPKINRDDVYEIVLGGRQVSNSTFKFLAEQLLMKLKPLSYHRFTSVELHMYTTSLGFAKMGDCRTYEFRGGDTLAISFNNHQGALPTYHLIKWLELVGDVVLLMTVKDDGIQLETTDGLNTAFFKYRLEPDKKAKLVPLRLVL